MRLAFLAAASTSILAATLFSFQTGALPGASGVLGTVPTTVARTGSGCGQCHTVTAGAAVPTVDFAPSRRSLDLSQSIQIATNAVGGVAGTVGGFVAEASAGTFSATQATKTDPSGAFVTHKLAGFGRSWQFGYTAPASPGVIDFYAVVNTADGDLTENGDSWSFHQGSQTTSVPIRMYANAAGVTHLADGCVGGFGLWPVLGAPQSPTAGSFGFRLEVHGATPSTAVVFLLGTAPTALDLTFLGLGGCTLWVLPTIDLTTFSTAGSPSSGDGVAALPLPLPAGLPAGLALHAQALVVDPASGRPLAGTMTNAVTITVQ